MNVELNRTKYEERDGYKCIRFKDIEYINIKVRWWVAKIIGKDEKYGFKREFLRGFLHDWKGRKTYYLPIQRFKEQVKEGDILEVAGGSWKNHYRTYVKIYEIGEEELVFEVIEKGEVEQLFP